MSVVNPETVGASRNQSVLELRQMSGRSVIGALVLRSSTTPPRAYAAAAASAWLSLGQFFSAAADCEQAVKSAANGLDELGQHDLPVDSELVDDTEMKLLAAEDLSRQGRRCDAGRLMLRVLETRLRLYARAHQDKIANLHTFQVEILPESRYRLWEPAGGAEAVRSA